MEFMAWRLGMLIALEAMVITSPMIWWMWTISADEKTPREGFQPGAALKGVSKLTS
jgi:hypothetical protein